MWVDEVTQATVGLIVWRQRTLWLLQAVQKQQSKVISAPGAFLSVTDKRQQEEGAQNGMVSRRGAQRNDRGQHYNRGWLIVNPVG